jgi:putative tricarboxylic transport membrane protein
VEAEHVDFIFRIKRDYYAGALMVLIGAVAVNEGRNYQLGTLQKMGPGYFPIMLGALLILLGVLIAGTASTGGNEEQEALPHTEWRGWAAIIAGPILFVLFGRYFGLLPATFACVFVAALGDRETTLKGAVILSTGVTIFGILLFSYLLKVSMPILKWGFS